jgi:drug/metabolite transporter (DMT)-like permease
VLFAQAVSNRVFGQRVSARELLGMTIVTAGVALLLVAA